MNTFVMQTIILKYKGLDREKRNYLLAFLISFLLHVIFLMLFTRDLLIIDLSPEEKDLPEEVMVIFPENKPKTVVENINPNQQIPEKSDLLSDFNSKAITKQMMERLGIQPYNEGNITHENLTQPNLQTNLRNQFQVKKFSKDALLGLEGTENQTDMFTDQDRQVPENIALNQQTTNNIYDQKKFSADQLGDNITLSTYAWEWAPYINAFKQKLYTVWFTPAAYHRLGLIHGETLIEFTISREGNLLNYRVHGHKGHESLKQSSINAITSVFPFKPLPENFPDENLTITARLIYPNLRRR